MDIRRGLVYWWNCPVQGRSHIQEGPRPVVIVSNDKCNLVSGVVTVVPFSTKIKKPYPQQVVLAVDGQASVALCDQITSVPVAELGTYIGDLTSYQMDQVDVAIAIQLGFTSVEDRPYSMFHGTR